MVHSARLTILQKELLQEYEKILFQEEALWFQKSREKWIKLGSRNTTFFHAQTVVRRKKNKIRGLNISPGVWFTDQEILRNEAVKYFKGLLGVRENVIDDNEGIPNCILSAEDRLELTKSVSKEEVYRALMSMNSYKAPGPDGFQPIFFKMFWHEVGDDVWKFVNRAFMFGRLDHGVSDALVVLIQKGDISTTFKDFRPISVCNVTYKIVSKVLVNRLRPILSIIISLL